MSNLILVNGAGGFLGSHVVEALLADGRKVRATDMPGVDLAWAKKRGAQIMSADLLSQHEAHRVTKDVDGVVNVAGLFDFTATREQLTAANVQITEHMCRAAADEGVTSFLHVASIAVYGTPRRKNCRETDPLQPGNDYEVTKKQGEDVAFRYHRERLLAVMSIRPTVIYGERSRYGQAKILGFWAMHKANGMQKFPNLRGGAEMSHVHVVDAARACAHLLRYGETGNAYNCADDTPIGWYDLFGFMREEVGIESVGPAISVPGWMAPPFGFMVKRVGDKQLEVINGQLAKLWARAAEKHGLKPYLAPRIDRDFLDYVSAHHTYDTARLKATGFRLQYPDTLAGMRDVIQWYREQKWIP